MRHGQGEFFLVAFQKKKLDSLWVSNIRGQTYGKCQGQIHPSFPSQGLPAWQDPLMNEQDEISHLSQSSVPFC